MSQKLFVRLSEEERTALEKMTRSGTGKARQITRARILLMADPNQAAFKTQEQSAHALGISPVTVRLLPFVACAGASLNKAVKRRLWSARGERPRPGQKPKITGEIEARLVTLACSEPPEGKSRWTVRLLRDELIRLEVIPDISHVAVHQALKKTNLSRGA